MGAIRYTVTSFRKPGIISHQMYANLKHQINENPNLEIDPFPETFTEHFSHLFKWIGVSLLIAIICLIFGKDGTIFVPIGAIAGLAVFVGIVMLFLEGPSYATYVKEKKEYFERMKFALNRSTSYQDFVSVFYS